MATCKICGSEIDTRNGYSQMMLKEQLCYDCFFWKMHLENDKKDLLIHGQSLMATTMS